MSNIQQLSLEILHQLWELGEDKVLKAIRHAHMSRLQAGVNPKDFKVLMVYINLLRETQNLVNNLRHHIQSVKCFNAPQTVSEEDKETARDGEY